ncbi:hypothetical protein RUM44_012303 [Polyplax serrata]|uniref:Uncharacterized protein n=1 Tax=Polyplax serrata TaxID=468196 RepID=A0ABR1BEV0_POLSC
MNEPRATGRHFLMLDNHVSRDTWRLPENSGTDKDEIEKSAHMNIIVRLGSVKGGRIFEFESLLKDALAKEVVT